MKIDRLISIILLLLRKERVQARELAERFGVSVRTIYRDIETISLAGIPVVTYQGSKGGLAIVEGYRLDRSVLTDDDMASLITMLKGYAAVIPDNGHEILLEKLKHVLSGAQLETLKSKVNQMIIDPSPWGGYGPVKEKIALIREALATSMQIEFLYADAGGQKTKRRVEPYSLLLKGHSWYLYAWCLVRQDFRLFKLLRMKQLVLTDVAFQPRELTPPLWEKEWPNPETVVELELAFDNIMADFVEELFGEEHLAHAEKRILVKLTLPENEWLYSYILSFGSGVEVINPLHIRQIIACKAKEIYSRYMPEI